MALLLKGGRGVFLHIPKTGGSWVQAVLEDCGLVEKRLGMHKHIDLVRLEYYERLNFPNPYAWIQSGNALHFRWNPAKHEIFYFVRNPLSWYESWWKYMSQETMNWKPYGGVSKRWAWHPVSELNGLGSDDFNEFIASVIEREPGFVSKLYSTYQHPTVSFVGKQESLVDDLIGMLQRLDLEFDEERIRSFRKVNKSASTVKPDWDPSLREEMIKLEYSSMKRYGYVESP